ncbi:MAG: nucleotidyl transferase AbiEii/AbiGii toxin family protein [Petrimonas sp.]|nr:nucleotidyl transferase AbiEii/AbiGii toxin family protein [Petrimonas sp.]
MIDQERLNIDWINQISKAKGNADRILVEKAIRALLLLEGLVLLEIPFVFKGGTSLMLHFNSTKRLSIDIDIIIATKIENLEEKLEIIANKQGFNRIGPQNRTTQTNIEKVHYKFFYTPIYKTAKEEEYVLLDILYEEVAYAKLMKLPIDSSFVPMKEDPATVRLPSLEDLLGDKLTAFAPNTTGIPYYKGEDSMSMEIMKQLYDISNLFDVCSDLDIIKNTFTRFAKTELSYRNDRDKSEKDVLEDIFQTSLCVVSRGMLGSGNFEELQLGIKRVSGFIFSETFHIEKAIIAASKAAYLSSLIASDVISFEKFNNPVQIKDWSIDHPEFNKLNKLKKSNPEAFFYWYKIFELRANQGSN